MDMRCAHTTYTCKYAIALWARRCKLLARFDQAARAHFLYAVYVYRHLLWRSLLHKEAMAGGRVAR